NRRVVRIDQLAAPFGDLLKVPVAAVAEHAAANAARSLVHCAADSGIGEREGAAGAGDAGADDRDGRLSGAKRPSRDDRRRGGSAGGGEEPAARDTANLIALGARGADVAQLFERHAVGPGDPGVAQQSAQRTEKWSSSHRDGPLAQAKKESL